MSKQLREQRAKAHGEALRAFGINNKGAYDKAMTEVDRLAVLIEADEKRSNVPSSLNGFKLDDKNHERAFAFAKWLKRGLSNVTETERRSLEFRDVVEGVLYKVTSVRILVWAIWSRPGLVA